MSIPYFLFAAGVVFVMVGTIVFIAILEELNAKLPPVEQFSFFSVNTKVFQLLRQHARLFPTSRKRSQMLLIMVVGFSLAATACVVTLAR